jgi:hypothetical protein
MSCDKNVISFLLVGVLRHLKKSDFSRRQNALLVVRSQYRYQVIRKIYEQSKVPSKICILSCAHISFKINMSLIQTTRAPLKTNSASPWVAPHSLIISVTASIYTRVSCLQWFHRQLCMQFIIASQFIWTMA